MTLALIIESGLNEAGTAVAVIAHPDRGAAAIVQYANDPFAAAMRRAQAELTGGTIEALFGRVSNPEHLKLLVTALLSSTPIQTDLSLFSGAAERWLGLRLSFPPQALSGVRHAILIGRDITDSRRNATQEERMRQLLAQIFMRVSAPVTIVGRSGELVMSNAAFRQLTGFSNEELKRLRVQDLTPPDLLESTAGARAVRFGDGLSYEMDSEALVKGGHRVAVRLTSVLLTDCEQSYRVMTLLPRTIVSAEDAPMTTGQSGAAFVEACMTRNSGELRSVSLDALRKVFGSDWPRIALRAMQRAEQAIRKRLKPDDLVSRRDDSNFLVWFSSDDHGSNTVSIENIVRDIRLAFLTEFGEEMAAYVSAALIPAGETAALASPVNAIAPQYSRMHKMSAR